MNKRMVASLPKREGLEGTSDVPGNVTVSVDKKGPFRLVSMNSHACVRVRGLMGGLHSALLHVRVAN